MIDGQKPNKPLFSQHYLEHRIQECPEWQVDVAAGFEGLKRLYLSKQALLPTLNEAQTEDVFIKPALDILGFSHIPQVTTSGKGRAERPDYALFTSESDRDVAYSLQNDEPAFYARVRAIAEAKYWERPLSKVSSNDQRDIYKNANPSFQIASYLTGTGVDWGILTNGREWRLYYRQASSTATEFYPVDLVELLESGDLERFKYFWLFFRQEALVKDPQGRNFLERVREGSTTYAQRVGNELKALVFDRVFPGLAGGFVADASRRGESITSDQVYEATLSFLYKLLFLLYAEARNLLPIDRDYRDYSLIKMTQEVADNIMRQRKLSQTSTGLYDRLLSLFQIVDRGDPGLEVPRYNGGLFHFEFSQPSDRVEYRANHFLSRFKLSDAVLTPVLDQLARFEGQPIDYSFLGVRQLGSIYEGLLEYRVAIADPATGNVHLENDKGDRKATGSYYTPDYIVKYIVSHTLKPILEQRQARFGELMTRIAQLHTQLADKRLGNQSLNGLRKDLQRLEREAQSTLLDIKVCDPAMGSGHFLVEAVDYLTDELIRILNLYPEQNPVLEMLEQTRQNILQNLEQQGISINPDRLEPTQLLQRVVMKRCIYGVDLNPMAVELAKVSLWLHSFTIGAPLSFLDHHLRCGNSLIGTTAREAEAAMSQESSGQFNLLSGPFVGLLRAAEIMRGVSVLSDATFAEVEQSETLFRSFDEAAKPYKRLLDIYVSKFFGLKRAEHFLRVFGTGAIAADPKTMNSADAAVYDDAQILSTQKRFFHWDLEFPEVFIDLENASWKENSGFDAVVGNPPYGSFFNELEANYLKDNYQYVEYRAESYVAFMERSFLLLIRETGLASLIVPDNWMYLDFTESLRVAFLEQGTLRIVVALPNTVFPDATVDTTIYIVEKPPQQINDNDYKTLVIPYKKNEYLLDIDDDNKRNYQRNQSYWLSFHEYIINPYLYPIEASILAKIDTCSSNLKEIATISYGLKIYQKGKGDPPQTSKTMESRPFTASVKINEAFSPFFEGQSINRYSVNWNHDNWIKWGKWLAEPRNKELFQKERLLFRKVVGIRLFGSFYKEEAYSNTLLYVVKLASLSRYSLKTLLTLLNSHLIGFIFRKKFAIREDDTFPQILLDDFSAIPIRNISFTTPTDRRQKALQNAIALYNQFQLDQNADPLLAQVNHHLSQQPEEADVIHDLLAHLAEQMIQLNKQKQAEIKSFLQWLERFIGCPIDTLNNKSKIQNYLGDYYKKRTDNADTDNDTGEPHLSFDTLIELLKKNKKKIKIDPVARKEQQTLEKEYQATLETLLPLKLLLMRCDRLIDAIVYKLYGLTEEEVAIVEGKTTTA
jgi:hypothetical protein